MKSFIRGQIVAILDEQRLVANVGMEQGVELGDSFIVFELGQDITDLATNQNLGKLELVKAYLEAVHVQEKLTLLMPTKHETSTGSTVLSAVLAQTSVSHTASDTNRDRLNVRSDQVAGMSRVTSSIAISDAVRSVKVMG